MYVIPNFHPFRSIFSRFWGKCKFDVFSCIFSSMNCYDLTHSSTNCVMCVVAFCGIMCVVGFGFFGLQQVALGVWLRFAAEKLAAYIVCSCEKHFVSTTVICALMMQIYLEQILYSAMVAVPLPLCSLSNSKCTLLVLYQL